jgi:hypothetical protein
VVLPHSLFPLLEEAGTFTLQSSSVLYIQPKFLGIKQDTNRKIYPKYWVLVVLPHSLFPLLEEAGTFTTAGSLYIYKKPKFLGIKQDTNITE